MAERGGRPGWREHRPYQSIQLAPDPYRVNPRHATIVVVILFAIGAVMGVVA